MNNQLSHYALTIYLRNVRTLEFIKYQCEESIEKINNKLYSMQHDLNNVKYYIPEPCRKVQPKFDIFELFCIIIPFSIISLIVGYILDLVFITFPLSIIIAIIGYINEYKKDKEAYFADQQRFANEQRQYQREYDDNINYYQNRLSQFQTEAQKRINQIKSYKSHIEDMLTNAYNLNIVPKPFRDIYGATYLYDFISTSGASGLGLSDAIINYSLEKIIYKLDKIINKCDAIIREQQNTNSNLREIQRQNNQLLSESKNISNNITLAKQYAEITAENSAVALELQKKQLAYQEVDFWLNKV